MKKALLILISVIVITVLLAQIDDDLSKDASDLIDRVEANGVSDAYLFLSGIYAGENENPIDEGRRILEESRKLDIDESYNVAMYDDAKKIPLPTGEAFCKTWEDGCLAYLFSSEIDTESLLNDHKVMISRANKFFEFDEYTTLTTPSIKELVPPYQYVTAAERISVLNAISLYKNGNPEEAIDSLLGQFSKLRKSLGLQDNLIGKLVFLMKLSEIIDVAGVILSQEDMKIDMIPRLSQPEKSFYMVVAREFAMSYYTLKRLDKHPEFFETGGDYPGWLVRIIFKPNMTINAEAPAYLRLEQLAQLSSSDFANIIESGTPVIPSTSKIRNYVGGVLITMLPNFDNYVARFKDFDAKLVLFNHKYSLGSTLIKPENPYYAGQTFKEIDGNICFDGPLEDKKFLRCLRTHVN